jgi:uncharacterized protein (TIGR03790 family)
MCGRNLAAFTTRLVCLVIAMSGACNASEPDQTVGQPIGAAAREALTARDLAVVVNENDRLSVQIADYYQRRRDIPNENVIRVRFDAATTMDAKEFAALRAEVMARTPRNVQAYALAWVRPYRVGCMSITTAFAAGFDAAFCSTRCTATRWSPYYNSNTREPFDQLGLRPTMSIAALALERARQLIDRGIAAGSTDSGTAYLATTDDSARNVRAAGYGDAALMINGTLPVEIVRGPLENKRDVLFYFIGAANVAGIATNRFLPGAIADHLTSFGGDLLGRSQMSSLRWLEAGATGSYGTVAEPCNLPGKFPNPGLLMKRYLAGETLLEAYWKSVAMPGQGLFIGEPLARLPARNKGFIVAR